jgi:multicomponent Na+:H+ antiporter subunit A
LTAAYTCRFVWGMFGRGADRWEPVEGAAPVRTAARPGRGFVLPVATLSAIGALFGVVPSIVDRIVGRAARSLDDARPVSPLALWHGWNLPLALSGVALGLGAALFLVRRRVDRVLAIGARVPTGTTIYLRVLRGTNELATRVTGVVQNGSLPIYAGVTLLVAAVVPGAVLIVNAVWPGMPRLAESPGQVAVIALMLAAALAAATARRRFSAALFLGTVGYAMAGLFVVHGAPDLALTQVAIETLSTVLFVLVLRRLPDRFERTSTTRRRVVRAVISMCVGVGVFVFAVVARSARDVEPVSSTMVALSEPEGHGRNVVNVILVDIRGLDTMGEITVLTAAAIGAVALARAGRARRARADEASS